MNTSRLTCLQSSVQYFGSICPPKIIHCEVLIQTSCCCCNLIRYCSQTSRWIEYLQPPRASGTLSSLSERLGGQSAPTADSLWKQSHSRDGFYYCLVTGIHWPPWFLREICSFAAHLHCSADSHLQWAGSDRRRRRRARQFCAEGRPPAPPSGPTAPFRSGCLRPLC